MFIQNKTVWLQIVFFKFYLFSFGCSGSLLLCSLSPSCSEQELLFTAMFRLLIAVAWLAPCAWAIECGLSCSLYCGEYWVNSWTLLLQWLKHLGSVVVGHRLNCSMNVPSSQIRDWNWCLLHWQMITLPLSHQESPINGILNSILSLRKKVRNSFIIFNIPYF